MTSDKEELPHVRQQIKEKAFRSRQQVGIYDPMEQAGHMDVVYVSNVFKVLDELAEKLEEELKFAYEEGLDDTDYGVCLIKAVLESLKP